MGEECLMLHKSLMEIMGLIDPGMGETQPGGKIKIREITLIGMIIATKSMQLVTHTEIFLDGMRVIRETILGSMERSLGNPNFREVGLEIGKLGVHWHRHLFLTGRDGTIRKICRKDVLRIRAQTGI